MKAIEYRKQAEQRQAEINGHFGATCFTIADRLSNDELIALCEAEGHRRLTKTAQRIATTTGHEQRMNRSDAVTIAASLIENATEA